MTTITLLTQEDCAFCEQAKKVLASVSADYHVDVTEIDVRSEEGRGLATAARFQFTPGVLLNGQPFSNGRLSERKLRRALDRMTT